MVPNRLRMDSIASLEMRKHKMSEKLKKLRENENF